MSEEVGSVRPNPYIFDIENRRKRKPRLAHDLGAGAKCNKCGDKCPGFELHFWRKICQNCRCGKDDHEVEDEDEDIGQVVIGKLFERPARTKKEELEYSYGNHLEMVNEETGRAEKLKFDWVPPNVGKNLAARYMALLPPNKRPVAGSDAAKQRKKQLEQQLPLYDMDETKRCDNMPDEELQSFMEYLDRIKTQVAGQGMVQEILPAPTKQMAQPLTVPQSHQIPPPPPPKPHSQAPGVGSGPNFTPGDGRFGSEVQSPYKNADQIPENEKFSQGTENAPNQAPFSDTYGQLDNKPYNQAYGHPKAPLGQKNSNMKDFMGEMIQDYQNMNLANSEPYGITPGTAQVLKPGTHPGDPNQTSSALQQTPAQSSLISSSVPSSTIYSSQPQVGQKQYSVMNKPGDYSVPPPPEHIPTDDVLGTGTVPMGYGTPGSKDYPYGTPGNKNLPSDTLGNKNIPSEFGQPGSQIPGEFGTLGNRNIPSEYGTPGNKNLSPGHGTPYGVPSSGLSPVKDGSIPPEHGTVPPYNQTQEGSVPGSQGTGPNWNAATDKQGFNAGHVGPVPFRPNLLPNQDGNQRNVSNTMPDQQAIVPGKEATRYGYHTGTSEPANIQSRQEAGNLNTSNMDNSEIPGDANLNQQGKALPHMTAMTPGTSAVAAVQAPYSAQFDTMKGDVMMAPGTDVNVLFPGESQVIGGPAGRSGTIPSNSSKFSCQYCSEPMKVGDVAVFCERAGPDKCWHPACFSCFTCHELLADLIYFYQDGKVYCGRHFTQAAQMPRCKACDELIFGNSWTRADEVDWHLHHFCCFMCDTPLAGLRYVPDKEGCPYCLPCYMSCLAKMCETCEEKIAPEETRCGHRGYFFHVNPQCFACHTCRISLMGKKFKMSKNWIFCSADCMQAVAEELQNNPNPKEKV